MLRLSGVRVGVAPFRRWSGVLRWLAGVVVVALVVAGVGSPAQALPPSDGSPGGGGGSGGGADSDCLTGATGTLSASSSGVALGGSVVLSWSVQATCTLVVHLTGPEVDGNAGRGKAGTLAVAPLDNASWTLTASQPAVGTITLAHSSVVDVEPPAGGTVTITSGVQAGLFVKAIAKDDEIVRIAGNVNLDLSNQENLTPAAGVQIIGDRSVFPTGPRLFTTTSPRILFSLTNDNVRITGIRLDGGESDDPFDSVGKPDMDGIRVTSAINIEIDHNEIYHWRGAAVGVHDGNTGDGPGDPNTVGRITRANADTVWVHDNYIHHNQHPNNQECGGNQLHLDDGGHAGGYGVEAAEGAYVKIERNVFDWNRHAIAGGDGRYGTGYLAYDNLILQDGGVHYRCPDVTGGLFDILVGGFYLTPLIAGVKYLLDEDGIYHTHAIDMHGSSSDHNSGVAGEYMDIEYNTILYTIGNGIKLRGTPTSPEGMIVKNNIFANDRQNTWIDQGAIFPAALAQTENGLHDSNNTYGMNTYDQRKTCDFDGDTTPDSVMATGVGWWYQSSKLANRWVFLHRSSLLLDRMTLNDVNGDGRCDITAAGTVYLTDANLAIRSSAAARNADGRMEMFGVDAQHQVWYRTQVAAGTDTWSSWRSFAGTLSTIAAETNGLGRIEVFGVDDAGDVFRRWQLVANTDSWSSWVGFAGAPLLSHGVSSIAVTRTATGSLDVLGVTGGGQLFGVAEYAAATGNSPDGSDWGRWSTWNVIGGSFSMVTAQTNGNGQLELFAVDRSGVFLYHCWERTPANGNFSGWEIFPGFLPINVPISSISATTTGAGGLELYATGGGHDYRRAQFALPGTVTGASTDGGRWSDWQLLGDGVNTVLPIDGTLASITADTNPDGRVELVGTDTSGAVYVRQQNAPYDYNFTKWTKVSDPTSL